MIQLLLPSLMMMSVSFLKRSVDKYYWHDLVLRIDICIPCNYTCTYIVYHICPPLQSRVLAVYITPDINICSVHTATMHSSTHVLPTFNAHIFPLACIYIIPEKLYVLDNKIRQQGHHGLVLHQQSQYSWRRASKHEYMNALSVIKLYAHFVYCLYQWFLCK